MAHRFSRAAALGAACWSLTGSAMAVEPSAEAQGVLRICARGPDADHALSLRAGGTAEVAAAAVLPNPSLLLQHQQTLDGPPDRETMIALSVPLGLGGRRFLRQDAAEARRAAGAAAGDALLVTVAIDAQEAIAAAALASRRAQILGEHHHALVALDDVLEGLTRGGEAARHDRSRQRVQTRLQKARHEAAEAGAASAAELVRSWLGVDAQAVDEPSLLSLAVARSRTPARAPHLVALEAEADASRLDADVAERGWIPEVDVYAGYRNVDGGSGIGHGLSLGLTVPLSFFDRGQGDAARAIAAEGVARSRLSGEEARIQRVERAVTIRLERLLATASEVHAAEREAAEVALASRDLYVAGEAPLTELFAAYQAQEDAQLAWIDRLEAIAAARLELMRARGALLDPALERACITAPRRETR